MKLGLIGARFIFLHVLAPILVGCLIYTLWRKPTLLVFYWYHCVGLDGVINAWRLAAEPIRSWLPNWFLFSLPDGLWVYAITSFMAALWFNAPKQYVWFWTYIGAALAIGGEFGQSIGLVQGAYDTTDVIFYVAGLVLAKFVVSRKGAKYERDCLGQNWGFNLGAFRLLFIGGWKH
jgi:hypothetical protein